MFSDCVVWMCVVWRGLVWGVWFSLEVCGLCVCVDVATQLSFTVLTYSIGHPCTGDCL